MQRCACLAACLVLLGVHARAAEEQKPPAPVVGVREISTLALDKDRFNARGKRVAGGPARVLPYEGKFKLTMVVDRVAPGRSVKWIAWFGNAQPAHGFTEEKDLKRYRNEKNPPQTQPLSSIEGFEARFLGREVVALPRQGEKVGPSAEHPGAAYSFHPDALGHNSSKHPLWMGPAKAGENVLYGLVHQRFVYHLMFRLNKGHFARHSIDDCGKLAGMVLPYTILLVEDGGERKRLLSVWRGEVLLTAFPKDKLRAGAGVTVNELVTVPRQVWSRADPVAWGGAADGLRLGLVPPGMGFRVGRPMRMRLLVRNVSEQARTILVQHFSATAPVSDDFLVEIRDAEGRSVAPEGACKKRHAFRRIEIKPGETREALLDLLEQGCVGVGELAPGKYTVRVHANLQARFGRRVYWRSTGAVPFEVLPAKDEESERATAE